VPLAVGLPLCALIVAASRLDAHAVWWWWFLTACLLARARGVRRSTGWAVVCDVRGAPRQRRRSSAPPRARPAPLSEALALSCSLSLCLAHRRSIIRRAPRHRVSAAQMQPNPRRARPRRQGRCARARAAGRARDRAAAACMPRSRSVPPSRRSLAFCPAHKRLPPPVPSSSPATLPPPEYAARPREARDAACQEPALARSLRLRLVPASRRAARRPSSTIGRRHQHRSARRPS
jgi:hypothetical protein